MTFSVIQITARDVVAIMALWTAISLTLFAILRVKRIKKQINEHLGEFSKSAVAWAAPLVLAGLCTATLILMKKISLWQALAGGAVIGALIALLVWNLYHDENPRTPTKDLHRPSGWSAEPTMDRVADGLADQVDRLRCLGNGQVPAVVRLAWRLLSTSENQRGRIGLPNDQAQRRRDREASSATET